MTCGKQVLAARSHAAGSGAEGAENSLPTLSGGPNGSDYRGSPSTGGCGGFARYEITTNRMNVAGTMSVQKQEVR